MYSIWRRSLALSCCASFSRTPRHFSNWAFAAGAWRVVEGGLDQLKQAGIGDAAGLGGGKAVGGGKPAVTPEADADTGEPQSVGGSLEGRVVGQREEDADAAGEADGRGLATTQLFQRGALAC